MADPDNSNQAAGVTKRAAEILDQANILRNPFFLTLQSGTMDRESFCLTQQQFYFAVLEFPRPMLSLMSRFPLPELRLRILENVLEEHGNLQPAAFHETTFRRFLDSIGKTSFDPDQVTRGPEVEAFNLTLMAACQLDPIEVGTACLGIIELAFADISALIGNAVIARGWLTADELVHYKLHADLDKQHAADMFTILEPSWKDPPRRNMIERGMQLGAYSFDRLYRDLWTRVNPRRSEENAGRSVATSKEYRK